MLKVVPLVAVIYVVVLSSLFLREAINIGTLTYLIVSGLFFAVSVIGIGLLHDILEAIVNSR